MIITMMMLIKLPGLLVDSAYYHPEEELFPDVNCCALLCHGIS